MRFSPVGDAILAIQKGQLAVVVDDEERENEGDLIGAAELVSTEGIAFMVARTSGVLCVAMAGQRLDQLQIPLMVPANTEAMKTAFTVSVDKREGTTTGISAADRAATIRALASRKSRAEDFSKPGHVFPLRARQGGVLERPGHTEAAVDLCRIAGLQPAGVLAEIRSADGAMARRDELMLFARAYGLPIISIKDLIAYRRRTEPIVTRVTTAQLPTAYGQFVIHGFQEIYSSQEHVALVYGRPAGDEPTLVRVHSECMTGEIFSSLRCDCKPQLGDSMRLIAEAGSGVVVYLRGHEGRGIGLLHKLRAYALQDDGLDTLEANRRLGLPVDARDYAVGAQILSDLGISKLRLLTNNPRKYAGISDFGLEIVERVPLLTQVSPENSRYLETKKMKMGHALGV